jgi:hypothetical protein
MDSTKKQARIAGLLHTLVACTAPIGLIYVPSKLLVAGDATATADRIGSSVGLVHLAMASELFHQGIEVFLVLVLYALFKGVSQLIWGARVRPVSGSSPYIDARVARS